MTPMPNGAAYLARLAQPSIEPPSPQPSGPEVSELRTKDLAAVYVVEIEHLGTGARGDVYRACHAGVEIVSRSRQPILDAARAMRDLGVTGLIEVWRQGVDVRSMTADIDRAAMLTVVEGDQIGPRFGRWKPFDTQRAGIAVAVDPANNGEPLQDGEPQP